MAIDSLQLDTKHKTIYLTTKGILVSMKYNNQKKTVDGITFDSILEARRYTVLKSRLEAGTISDLRLQPHYTIMEGLRIFPAPTSAPYNTSQIFHILLMKMEGGSWRTPKECGPRRTPLNVSWSGIVLGWRL